MSSSAFKQSQQASDSRSGTRIIKVGSMVRFARNGRSTKVPFIRLSGKWLEDAGFQEGDFLAVCVQHGEMRMICSSEGTAQLPAVDKQPADSC